MFGTVVHVLGVMERLLDIILTYYTASPNRIFDLVPLPPITWRHLLQ